MQKTGKWLLLYVLLQFVTVTIFTLLQITICFGEGIFRTQDSGFQKAMFNTCLYCKIIYVEFILPVWFIIKVNMCFFQKSSRDK